MFKRPLRLSVFVGLTFLSAIFVSVLSYPQTFLAFKTSWMLFYDYLLEYEATAIIINFLFNGGVQLWDHFGQMPFAYLYTTLGVFKFPNVLTAGVYALVSPFAEHAGLLYHHVFTWVNLFTLLFLRVIGIFLLLRRFTKNTLILYLSTVIFSVFYCQPAFCIGTYYQSLYPILLYLILCCVDEFKLKYAAAAFILLVIAFASGAIPGSYMYLGIHFFMISALVWSFFLRQGEWKKLGEWLKRPSVKMMPRAAAVLAAALVIIGPYVWLQRIVVSDFEFDIKNSRLGHMFDIGHYFHGLVLQQVQLQDFRQLLDFTSTPGQSFFLGFMFFVLLIAGIVLAKDSRKWIFAGAMVLVALINFPRESLNVGLAAHWLNVLTNPLKAICRSYHMASLSIFPYLSFPLVVMGIEEMVLIFSKKKEPPGLPFKLILAGLVILAVWGGFFLPGVVKIYLGLSFLATVGIVMWGLKNKPISERKQVLVVFAVLITVDVLLIGYQTNKALKWGAQRRPMNTVSLFDQGGMEIDFPNPAFFPVREHGAFYFTYEDDSLIGGLIGMHQNYFKHSNFMINFVAIDGHYPRHKSYGNWRSDPEIFEYLKQNHRLMFTAPLAVRSEEGMMSKICQARLAQDVVMVEDPSGALNLSAYVPASYTLKPKPRTNTQNIQGKFGYGSVINHDEREDIVLGTLPLPQDFSGHLATTFFTDDRDDLEFLVRKGQTWQKCAQVQGEFLRPYTFDVNHFKQGMLTVALPRDWALQGRDYMFVYPSEKSEGLVNVWRKEFDHLGITYQVPRDGWFVLQYPYDSKWRISVDGRFVPYYRVNKSFIGFKIEAGTRKIYLEYCPGSLLRIWLSISAVFMTVGLATILGLALRWESKRG